MLRYVHVVKYNGGFTDSRACIISGYRNMWPDKQKPARHRLYLGHIPGKEKEMKKFVKVLHKICRILELVVAVFVLGGILIAILSLLKEDVHLIQELLNDMSVFRHYLEQVFTIVIGIEFLEMLCHPNSDNVIQVLIFLVARHMIVETTTPFEDFISVVSVTILFLLRRYMHSSKPGTEAED
jgi:hypothetical protein